MWKPNVILLVCLVAAVTSFSVDLSKNATESSEVFEPRTTDKSLKFLYTLYKIFSSMKSNSETAKLSKPKYEIVPLNGVYPDSWYNNPNRRKTTSIEHFKTLEELNREEGIANMKDMGMVTTASPTTTEAPQFWVFDNFSKRVDLLVMTKVLLKLIIFKKIVKFIALVCLLFFIPTLKDKDEEKKSRNDDGNFYIAGEKI